MDRLCGWMCPTVSRSINYDFSFQICRGPVRARKRHTGEFCEGRYTLLQAAGIGALVCFTGKYRGTTVK